MSDTPDEPTFEGPEFDRPADVPFDPQPTETDVRRCPACLSPIRADQRYCLECGERLAPDEIPPPPPGGGSLGEPNSLFLLAATAILIVVGAGLAWVALREPPADGGATTATTETVPTDVAPTDTIPTDTIITEETITEETFTEETITEEFIDDWPAGESGWAVILASKAVDRFTLADAEGIAEEARVAGVPLVGVLDSSNYPSLNPGYWAVFSGPYPTRAEAEAELATVRSLGFADAYPREVIP